MPSQKPVQRHPRQKRAQDKIELILEATIRLLEKGGLDALTTNAIAVTAGVSIGTLYQYFANKEAILEALADRETAAMSERLMATVDDPAIAEPHQRIGAVIDAVAASYGARREAYRMVMAWSMARGSTRLGPILARLTAATAERRASAGLPSRADAFVMTHALRGVLRAMIAEDPETVPPRAELEAALFRLFTGFAVPDDRA